MRRFRIPQRKRGNGESTGDAPREGEGHSFPDCGKLFPVVALPPRGGQGVTGVKGQGRWENWEGREPSVVHFHEEREWRHWECRKGGQYHEVIRHLLERCVSRSRRRYRT